MRFAFLLAACSIATASAQAFQAVHVVNGGTGTALQSAIDSATSGDTVLVHGGDFLGASIVGKTIQLVAEPAFGTRLRSLNIEGLAANQSCVVAGIDVLPNTLTPAISVQNCLGSVRLQEMRAQGAANSSVDALVIGTSADVACTASTFVGGSQIPTPGPNPQPSYQPGRGIVCTGSQLALYDCVVQGGAGQDDHFINAVFDSSGAGPGGVALSCSTGSTMFASRSSFTGGSGGYGNRLTCLHLVCGLYPTPGANGGAGVGVAAGANVAFLDCVASGGSGGVGGTGGQCCPGTPVPNAPNGAPGAPETGTVAHFGGAGTTFLAPSIVRAGSLLPLTVLGTPGDTILLSISNRTGFAFDPFYSGVILLRSPARRGLLGMIPGGGTISVSIPLRALPPGALSVERYLQVVARDPSGQLRLGGAAFVTVVDPAF